MKYVSTFTLDDKDYALVEYSLLGEHQFCNISVTQRKVFKLIESPYSKKVNIPDKILAVVLLSQLSSILVKRFNYYL